MKVRDLCREHPAVSIECSLKEAVESLIMNAADAIVVLENKRPVGMLGSFEVLEKVVEGTNPEDVLVKALMNHHLLLIDAAQTAEEAAEILLAHKHWMAIVTENKEYRGVVTAGGLLKELQSKIE